MWDSIQQFQFLRPWWLLALIPFACLLWIFLKRKLYAGSWAKVCDDRLLPHLLEGRSQKRSSMGSWMIGLLGTMAIIALAGPAWKQLPQPVFRAESALVIVLDLSRSMDVSDIKPSRLARARHKIIDILNKRREGQTALIVYALEPFVVTPLTQDNKTVSSLVKDLDTRMMPGQGSYPEKAIIKAVELFKQTSVVNGHVLLITDGVDSTGMPKAVQQLTDAGHQMSILAIATEDGAPIAERGGGFIKDESGAIVVSKLDPENLRDLASQGNGIYRKISADDSDINSILRLTTAAQSKREYKQKQDALKVNADQWREEGPWLLLFLLPLAALVFRRGYLVILVTLLAPVPQDASALDWNALWQTPDQRAAKAMEKNQPATAAQLFNDPQWKAVAQYRAENYSKTVDALEGIATADAYYNKGNALAKLGKLPEAIASYNEALALQPDMEDARYNRDLLQKYLKQQQQDQQKQNQQDQDQSQNQQGANQQNAQDQANQQQQQQQQQSAQQQSDKQSDHEKRQQTAQSSQPEDNENQQEQRDQMQQQAGKEQDEKERQAKEQLEQQMAQENNQENKEDQSPQDDRQHQEQIQANLPDDNFSEENKQMQLTEQWLRRIPDDPGGLLRRKFRYQSTINPGQARQETKPW